MAEQRRRLHNAATLLTEWVQWKDGDIDPDTARSLQAEAERLREESTRLRAALAVSKDPCVYCQLPAEDMAKCRLGFPGCGRADDMMGCAEFGASLQADTLQAENARLRARVGELEGCLSRLYPHGRSYSCSAHQEDGHFECETCYPTLIAMCGHMEKYGRCPE